MALQARNVSGAFEERFPGTSLIVSLSAQNGGQHTDHFVVIQY